MSEHEHRPPTLPPDWSEDQNDMWLFGPGSTRSRVRISYGTECNMTRPQAISAAWGIAREAKGPSSQHPHVQDVIEDFDLNYHVGSAVAALLEPHHASAAAPLTKALIHVVREQRLRGIRRSHEDAAHHYADEQDKKLRELAQDAFTQCLEQPDRDEGIAMLKMALRGLVVSTFKESRRQFGLDI